MVAHGAVWERSLCGLVAMAGFAIVPVGCSGNGRSHPGPRIALDGGGPEAGRDATAPLLDPAARKELEDLGVDRYAGKAVESATTTTPLGAVRVEFDPASGPICLDGDRYAAFYLDRGSNDLAIVLDGGGACWTSLCSATPVVTDEIYDTTKLLAFAEPAGTPAPADFHDWNVVSVPYCDGSVFMGDGEVTFDGTPTRYHHGRRNLAAALDLAVKHFPHPKRVLLAGFSAGGYGTITAMLAVRLRFPDVEISVFDDSGPGLFNPDAATDMQQRKDEWKYESVLPESCTECFGPNAELWPLIGWMLQRDSGLRFSVASYDQDSTISIFLRVSPDQYATFLQPPMQLLRDQQPDRFRRYFLPGRNHVLSGEWSTLTADGKRLDSWVRAMTDGDDAVWQDIQAVSRYTCPYTDEASCDAVPGCSVVRGRERLGGPLEFVGCRELPATCEGAPRCAISSDGSQCLQFDDLASPTAGTSSPVSASAALGTRSSRRSRTARSGRSRVTSPKRMRASRTADRCQRPRPQRT